ncbi:hypothetical protein BU24DRAFT_403502 [Aaosphaeria arxii CBS 175.79]|uniref:Uncharacterized protein n=1 Tax=Aaosphaeria arxii CBS 175.79 TaxID=1450172 RepID=A0A6A5Y490_9PLEO|nr:uncharacterized protein BU24DRAFT_403502 [Aaosphaeria arxii CBS 175.79]KAF2020385.1 hypothetical protein BU24DRAFT_403502 [Aaosphaeria arxii CBS 175.79]
MHGNAMEGNGQRVERSSEERIDEDEDEDEDANKREGIAIRNQLQSFISTTDRDLTREDGVTLRVVSRLTQAQVLCGGSRTIIFHVVSQRNHNEKIRATISKHIQMVTLLLLDMV